MFKHVKKIKPTLKKSLLKFKLKSDWLQDRIELNIYISIMYRASYPISFSFHDGSIICRVGKFLLFVHHVLVYSKS